MSSSEGSEFVEVESRISRLAFIPILRGRTNSAVSNRIVKLLKQSSFCSSSPLLKKLIVQNVQVCCIVIETSGTRSISVICASVPYLLRLLAKANPKLKRIIEDESVTTYFKFFQEADLESLLTSICTASVIIQKGVKMCFPSTCIQLSREALLFGQVYGKAFVKLCYNGLISAFHFIWEDLGPTLRSLCERNQTSVKYLARNLPNFALAGAKGLVLFSLLVRRVISSALKTLRRFLRSLCYVLQNSAIDSLLLQSAKKLQLTLREMTDFLASENAYKYCKSTCVYITNYCFLCAKELLPVLWKDFLNVVKHFIPALKKHVRSATQLTSKSLVLAETYLKSFIVLCYNSKPVFELILSHLKPFSYELYQMTLNIATTMRNIGYFATPYCKTLTLQLLNSLYDCCFRLLRCSKNISNQIRNVLYYLYESCPNLRDLLCNALGILNSIFLFVEKFAELSLPYIFLIQSNLQNGILCLHKELLPLLTPTVQEINLALSLSSNELIKRSVCGLQRIIPSLWRALSMVLPVGFRATHEVLISSKNSIVIMYPSIVKALVTMHPEVSKIFIVVLKDGTKAAVEVSAVSYVVSCELAFVAKSVSSELPVISSAFTKVKIVTYSAMTEVAGTSLRAQTRVLQDMKAAVGTFRSSLKSIEFELEGTYNEIVTDLNYSISESPEAEKFFTQLISKIGGVLLRLQSSICKISLACLNGASEFKSVSDSLIVAINKSISEATQHLDLKTVAAFVYGTLETILTSSGLKSFLLSLKNVLSSIACNSSKCIGRYVHSVVNDFLNNTAPKLWIFFKHEISLMWQWFCEFLRKVWAILEEVSSRTWHHLCEKTPEVWSTSKHHLEALWELTCKTSPDAWKVMVKTTPIMYDYNRQLVQRAWKLYRQTCSDSWKVLVPVSSTTWIYTTDICPKVWAVVVENSKIHWKQSCLVAKENWETVTENSASSWSVFRKMVSSTWHHGLRPTTVLVCSKTSSVMTKSITFSNSVYNGPEKVLFLLRNEISDKSLQLCDIVFPNTSLEVVGNTTNIFKKCFDFSQSALIQSGSKRDLVTSTVSKLGNASFRIADKYSNYLTFGQLINSLVSVSKISLIPMTMTYGFAQELIKKYSSICDSVLDFLPTNQIVLLL